MTTRAPQEWGVPDLARQLSLGASPRATLGLLSAGRALAVLRGRRFVVPQDIFDVAPEVLRHRLLLTYDAIADDITTDNVISTLLSTVPAPHVTPKQDDAQPTAMPPTATAAAPQQAPSQPQYQQPAAEAPTQQAPTQPAPTPWENSA
jgi:MoxR-like ATPase